MIGCVVHYVHTYMYHESLMILTHSIIISLSRSLSLSLSLSLFQSLQKPPQLCKRDANKYMNVVLLSLSRCDVAFLYAWHLRVVIVD